jgi:opine dehydrogenase
VSETISIIGAGNGGCAAAADLTLNGWEVTLYNRTAARLQPLRVRGGIRLKDPEDRGVVGIHAMTSRIDEALASSNRVAVMVPTSALGHYGEAMAPYVTHQHRILLAPGHTGGAIHFRRALSSQTGEWPARVGEAHTLPYICRMTGAAEVTVWKRSDRLLFAGLPALDTKDLLDTFSGAFTALTPVSSVLETSLSNFNAVMHPAGMVLNAGWIEHTSGEFRYYSEGTTPSVARVVEATDNERRAIGRSLGIELEPFIDAFYSSGYTTEEAWTSRDMYRAIKESPPNREIKAPESLEHRYVHEDIGFGLVPMMAMAVAANVDAATIAALIRLASVATGMDFATHGLSAEKLGIAGLSGDQLQSLALEGH